MRRLEGVMRAGRPSGSTQQDYRLSQLESRAHNLEVWANSTGHFGTPPATVATISFAETDFLAAGDPA
jgi:hypothetical protein